MKEKENSKIYKDNEVLPPIYLYSGANSVSLTLTTPHVTRIQFVH